MLDWIKAHHLLTTAQANLAVLVGITMFLWLNQLHPTIAWRDALALSWNFLTDCNSTQSLQHKLSSWTQRHPNLFSPRLAYDSSASICHPLM